MPAKNIQIIIVDLKRAIASLHFNDQTKWQQVRHSDSLSQYFPGGSPAIEAFGPTLNGRSRFRQDGMNLRGSDIREATVVRDLTAAIRTNYRDRGWTVS